VRKFYTVNRNSFRVKHCTYKPKVPKLCTYSFLFLLSVFIGTVSRVLICFCSYKLEFYHELFSDSQKARIKLISKWSPNFNRPHFHLVMERAKFNYNEFAWDWTRAPPDSLWTLYHWAMEAVRKLGFRFYLITRAHSCFGGFFSIFLAHFLQRSWSKHCNTSQTTQQS